ncbi:MAG: DNA cytosine methyltransferase [Gammaproteobacteria bacterium]|nr:DNA cytosine methyltransferase [Gammaproteobacteria bacterium]
MILYYDGNYSNLEYFEEIEMRTVVSLFTGAGGLDIGFQNAGFEILAANELDPHACETYRANHPKTDVLQGPIEEHTKTLSSFKGVDVVIGGPPCQGFSVAGRMDPNDERSKLVFAFSKTVAALRPKAFVMENVKSLGTLEKFRDVRQQLLKDFEEAGYKVEARILNAKDFGVPQGRERVFFVGVQQDAYALSLRAIDNYRKSAPTLRDVIKPLGRAGSDSNSRTCNAKVTLAAKPVLRKSPYAGMLFNGQGRPLNPDGWSSTLPASMGGNRTPIIDENHLFDNAPSWVESYHAHLMEGGKPYSMHDTPKHLRRLTIDEAVRIQTFPIDYIFKGPQSKVFCQLGNAVPCGLAEAVARGLNDMLNGNLEYEIETGDNLELAI